MSPVIPAAFALLAILLLWQVAGSRGPWKVKLALILLVPAFAYVVWTALNSYAGWPTRDRMPAKGLLVWGVAVEPDKMTGSKGAIYIWLVPAKRHHGLLDYAPRNEEPRAYRLPYDRATHEALQEALREIAKGHPMVVGRQEHRRPRGGRRGRPNGSGSPVPPNAIRFYRLPPPKLPEKDR